MRLSAALFPFSSLLVAILLLVPTFANPPRALRIFAKPFAGGRDYSHSPATRTYAANAYAAASGCELISTSRQCDADLCFHAGGRCKRPYPGGPCMQHLHDPETGTEILTRWKPVGLPSEVGVPASYMTCEECRCRAAVVKTKRKKGTGVEVAEGTEGAEGDQKKARKGGIGSEDARPPEGIVN